MDLIHQDEKLKLQSCARSVRGVKSISQPPPGMREWLRVRNAFREGFLVPAGRIDNDICISAREFRPSEGIDRDQNEADHGYDEGN